MKKFLKSHNIFTAIFAVIIILTIVVPPIFGLGDLSEYTSTFESVGLYNAGSDSYAISQNYGIGEPDGRAKSVFHNFLMAIISINKMLFSKTVFNIHFLSTMYCLIFLLGVYFLQKNAKFEKNYLNYVFSALIGLIFMDLGYLAYFNSFYTDALVLVLVIALCAIAVSYARKFSYIKVILFVLSASLLAGIKFSAAVAMLFMGAIFAYAGMSLKKIQRIVSVLAAVIVAVASVFSMIGATVPARDVKLYNLIYNDFAVIDSHALEYFGVEEMESKNPSMDEMSAAVDGITYIDVAKYYASNPKVFFENMKSAANNSYFLIQDFAAYREAGATYGIRENLPIKIWNTLKKRVLPHGIWVILAFIIIYAVVAVREHLKNYKEGNKEKSYIALFAFVLPIGALSELIATVITTGKILISKNMFAFGIYFDLMLITTIVWAAATLISRNENIKAKYGVKQ